MSLHQFLLLVLGAAMLARVGAMFTRERLLSGSVEVPVHG